MSRCVSRDQLQQFLEDRLSDALQKAIETHVEGCEACREVLEHLSDYGEEVDAQLLREARPGAAPESLPDWVRQLEEAPPDPAGRETRPMGEDEDLAIEFPGPPTDKGPLGGLGSFHICKELGVGKFGVVYQAYDELDRLVALKVLKPELAASARERTRFEEEGRKAAAVKHDHIVTVHQVGHTPGFPLPYLVLEYFDGEPLSNWLRRQRVMHAREAARVVQQVTWGLAAAHAAGLVHRDIKPSNILLEKSTGRAKITDFGLARVIEEPGTLTNQSGRVVGTPAYMSPEQVLTPERVDARSDIYSLGVVLYELLTGEPPFRGRTQLVLQQVVREEPRPLRRLNDLIPRDLETICLCCLQKEPGKRYATASALAEDLRRYLAGEPIQARPIRSWERVVKWSRRRPAIAALLALVVILTVSGFGLVTWQWRRAETASQAFADKARELGKKTEELEVKHYARNITLAASELSAGDVGHYEELLDECPERLRGWEWHYLKRLRYAPPLVLPVGGRLNMMGDGFDIAFSPDGRLLVVPGGDNSIRVWDVTAVVPGAPTPRLALRGHTGLVLGVAFSPDGRRLASTGADKAVRVWNLTTGQGKGEARAPLLTLRGHTERVQGVAFSPDGRRLASTGLDQSVKVWDAATGRLLHDLPGQSLSMTYLKLTFSPDGRWLASGSANNTIKVWDASTGREVFTLVGHSQPVFHVSFSADGRRLVSAGRDLSVKVWDLPPGEPEASAPEGRELTPRFTFRGHSNSVWGLALSSDGRRLAMGGGQSDGIVRVYDVTTGETDLTLQGHIERVTSVAFSADGRRLVSAGLDKNVKLWELTTGQEVLTLRGHTDLVGRVLFSPQGSCLASASADDTVRVWDASAADESLDRHILTFRGHAGIVYGLAFSPDGTRLASASADHSVKVWDPMTGREVRTLQGHTGTVFSVAYSPDGKVLLSGSNDWTARRWDPVSGRELPALGQFNGIVRSAVLSPDGQRIATASRKTVQIWDAQTGRELFALSLRYQAAAWRVAFSPDGKLLATASADATVRVWNAITGADVHTFRHRTRVFSVAFSPNGRLLASGDGDGQVKLWDPTTSQEVRTLAGHTDYVFGIAFSPDGRWLATASWREVIVWNTQTWEKTKTLSGLAGTIWSVAFSPDSTRLAAAGGYKGKGEIKIWDASIWEK